MHRQQERHQLLHGRQRKETHQGYLERPHLRIVRTLVTPPPASILLCEALKVTQGRVIAMLQLLRKHPAQRGGPQGGVLDCHGLRPTALPPPPPPRKPQKREIGLVPQRAHFLQLQMLVLHHRVRAQHGDKQEVTAVNT